MKGHKIATTDHVPVLPQEAVEALAVQPGGRYIDCTVGGGGHAATILENSSPGGQLLGIDADPQATKAAKRRLEAYRGSCLLVNDNFVNLEAICIKYDFFPVHGILLDLGLSSAQLGIAERGFSFLHDGPLDMRLSPEQKVTAADIVNGYSEGELGQLIRTYGEERYSRRIAHYIVQNRPINTTLELARTAEQAISRQGRIHPATRTFQALRIAVNHELDSLEIVLKQAINLIGYQGKLVVISYHSLEDRIVKRFMQREAKGCICPPEIPTCICGHTPRLRIITGKAVAPSRAEVQLNPRSRSAKLRAAEPIISHDAYYQTIGENCIGADMKINGWRKPALLKKLRAAFSTAI